MMKTARKTGTVVCGMVLLAGPLLSQSAHRTRRESNANRKARIARTIEQTYGHRWEVGAGGGFERFRSGEFKQRNNEVTFWASALYGLNPKLGVVGLASGGFGSAKLNNTVLPAKNPQIQNYSFMAGPSYRFVRRERYAVSGYAAGGIGLGRFGSGPFDRPPAEVGLYPSELRPAFSAGVNLDLHLFPNLSVRATPFYLGTTYGGQLQNNKGVNAGVVYRFGGTK